MNMFVVAIDYFQEFFPSFSALLLTIYRFYDKCCLQSMHYSQLKWNNYLFMNETDYCTHRWRFE